MIEEDKKAQDRLRHQAQRVVRAMLHLENRVYMRHVTPERLAAVGPEALQAIEMFISDIKNQIDREKHTFRPFPGGPRIRM